MNNSSLNNPTKGRLIESYRNGANWYRIYSDGWCEQGGAKPAGQPLITYLVKMADSNYDGYASGVYGNDNSSFIGGFGGTKSQTQGSFILPSHAAGWWSIQGYKE